jgi:beta-glucanase (GH16 family)
LDLDGNGKQVEAVTVTAGNTAGTATLSKATLKDSEALAYHALACEGVSDGGELTLSFTKPVWSAGVTFRSGRALDLRGSATAPAITYTLSDGSTVNVAASGASAGHIQPDQRTFVGVIDQSGKGIKSITFRVNAAPGDKTPLYIDDIAFAIAGPPPGDWKMTLNDNFDGDKLNPDIWSTGYKFVDVINNELQAYVPENVTVGNGVCTIKVEHRAARNTDRFGHEGQAQHFASGAFTSVDKWTQTYGYFEARIKMPKARGAGVWPAFWLLPDRGKGIDPKYRYSYMTKDYGRGMEIDIFEFMPRWKQRDGRFPLHVGCIWSYGPVTAKDPAPHGYGGYAKDNDGWGPKELTFPNLDGEYHTYGLYWSKDRLIYYVDSKPIFRVHDPEHVPNVPFYFLFNVAVHQNGWGKSPDKTNPTMKDIITDMPNAMEIDYFRAYSGTLREDVPARTTSTTQSVVGAEPPGPPATDSGPGDAPAAPVNVGISTPSN